MTATTRERVRRPIIGLSTATATAALVGAVQLATGTFTPPVSDLEGLGLDTWLLPGLWLALSVAVPCGVAALLAFRRSPSAGNATVVAAGLLAVELLVQVPFVGADALQVVMGLVAVLLAVMGVAARRSQ